MGITFIIIRNFWSNYVVSLINMNRYLG